MAEEKGNFASVLDRPSNEIKRPQPLPQGSYVWVTKGLPRHDKSAKKGTPFSEFMCVCLQALDDVDQEALQAMGGCNGKTQKLTFYHTDDSIYREKDFLTKTLLIDDEDGTRSVRQMESDSVGIQFVGTIGHTPSEDGETMYGNIVKTISIDAYNESQQ